MDGAQLYLALLLFARLEIDSCSNRSLTNKFKQPVNGWKKTIFPNSNCSNFTNDHSKKQNPLFESRRTRSNINRLRKLKGAEWVETTLPNGRRRWTNINDTRNKVHKPGEDQIDTKQSQKEITEGWKRDGRTRWVNTNERGAGTNYNPEEKDIKESQEETREGWERMVLPNGRTRWVKTGDREDSCINCTHERKGSKEPPEEVREGWKKVVLPNGRTRWVKIDNK